MLLKKMIKRGGN